jgi:two-component system, LytTR family, sensor kinase
VILADYLSGIIACGLILGLSYARERHLRFCEEEIRASRLAEQLAQARLEALRMQLQPHFLFNSLNAISALQGQDVEAAQTMIARLADFLRLTIDNSGAHEVELRREIDFLAHYLEIERICFRKGCRSKCASTSRRSMRVPNLILQPIVENAISHGIVSPREADSAPVVQAAFAPPPDREKSAWAPSSVWARARCPFV